MAETTTGSVPGPTDTNNNRDKNDGPTSSPLLFFVALGFGVVFTNLWIIVGVKYCFRYNQRNRARALGENGEPIDLTAMPRPHRRRREKKLMSMEEVNERFPLTKYKIWRSTREAEGLPAAGGVTAPPSRAASLKNEEGTLEDARASRDSARQYHDASATPAATSADATAPRTSTNATRPDTSETAGEKPVERLETATTDRNASVLSVDDDIDDDDPIRTAAPPEMLAAPGDACAICLDTLEDEDDCRGLTCGHAFHGACVDPWLTSRRACCPLCKADYYIPKPRADGTEDPALAGNARRMPQNPPPVWLGTRGGNIFRPRMIFAGPRLFMGGGDETAQRSPFNASPRRQERTRREEEMVTEGGNVRDAQPAGGESGWRSRLPNVRLPGLGRSRGNVEAAPAGADATPSQLEAQTRQTPT